jgi:hypothetical protein
VACLASSVSQIKFENVKGIGGSGGKVGTCPDAGAEMPLASVVDGIYASFLQEKDAHDVVTEFQQPLMPRYGYPETGAEAAWNKMWKQMDLSHVFGFPLWEEGVYKLLLRNFKELKCVLCG